MTAKSKGKAAGRRDDDDDIEEFDDEYGTTTPPLSRSSSRRVVTKTVKATKVVNPKNSQTKKTNSGVVPTQSGNPAVQKKKSPTTTTATTATTAAAAAAAAAASSSTKKTTIPSSNKPPLKPPARNGSFRSSLPGNTKQQSQRSLGVTKSSHRPTTLSRASSTRSCNNRSSSSPSLKTQRSERNVTNKSKTKGFFDKLQDEIEFVDDTDHIAASNTSRNNNNNNNRKGKAPRSTRSLPATGGVSRTNHSGNMSRSGGGGPGVSRTNSVRSMKSQKSQRSVTSSMSRTNSTRSIVDKFQDECEFVDDPDDYNASATTGCNNNNKRKAPPSTRSLPAGLSRINSSSRNVSGGRGGSGGGSGGGSVVSGVSRTNSVRSMKSQKSQRSLTSTLSRSNSTRSMQTQKNKKSYIRIIDDGGGNHSNHDHHLSRSKSQRSMTSHTSRTSITTSQRFSTTSTSSSSARRKKSREEHLKDLLGQGSYHLPGHSWCQDWLQYFGNNHPLFCVFFQHPLHPVSRCIKAVQLVGSIMVGLVITNVIYLLLIYDKHDDLIDLPKAGGGGDTGNTTTTSWKLLETQEEQSELIKEYTEIQLDPGMWVLWTVGGAIHAIWDNTVWYATACSCFDSELLWVRRFKQTCNFLVVVFVTALIAAGTLAVLIRAHVEGGGELDAAMLTAKASDNSQAIMDVQNYEFMMSYAVELAVAWFLWFPIIETILFSGVLGFCCPCCISCLGGRPAEVKAEQEEADLERGSMRFM